MFGRGRHRSRRGGRRVGDLAEEMREAQAARARQLPQPGEGPFDGDAPVDGLNRLDLGSLRLPLPPGSQLHVEMNPDTTVHAVHVLTELGQLTVHALAAPRSQSLWSQLRAEAVQQLRADGAAVREVAGQWGNEVHAVTGQGTVRLLGVDGPRWMLRAMAIGPAERHAELIEVLHHMVRGTVVVRGVDAQPVRGVLPLTLPGPMAEQAKQAASGRQGQLR